MQSKRASRLQLVSDTRAVVALHPVRKARARDAAGAKLSGEQIPPGPRRPDPDAALAFSSKIELAAAMVAALGAEALCLRIPLPANLNARLARVEVELEVLAHDVLAQGAA